MNVRDLMNVLEQFPPDTEVLVAAAGVLPCDVMGIEYRSVTNECVVFADMSATPAPTKG